MKQLELSLDEISLEINSLHSELCAVGKQSIGMAIRVGELLAKAKAQLSHGQWLPWFKENIRFSQRTASNYGRLYRERAKLANFANLSDAYALFSKRLRRESKRDAFNERLLLGGLQQSPDLLPGPFEIILADPPWRYQGVTTTPDRVIEQHYETCTVEEICGHSPDSAKNAVLFLWATAPLLPEALQVMDAWGFAYKTNAVWDKEKIGMGYWFRIQHEHLLVGTKGKVSVPPEEVRISSVFRERRTRHSKKPLAVYEWLELAFPDKSKLEMYCRTPRHGWNCWGREVAA